jgi:hypothetical protein
MDLPEELKSESLSFEEKASLEHFSFFYLCYRDNKKIVACMYFQLIELQADFYPDIASMPLSAAGLFKYLQGRDYRLLVCGHVFFNYRRSVHVTSQLSTSQADKVYARCIREAIRMANADIFLAKEPTEDFGRFLQKNPRRFLSVGPDNLMTLSVRPEWGSSSEYAASLKKKYLQRLKKIREASSGWTFRDVSLVNMELHRDEIMNAYIRVLHEAEFKLGKLNFNFFHQLLEWYPEKVVFRLWYFENQIQGFSSLLIEDNAVELYYIGLPANEELKKSLYQLMMLNALDFAIEKKLEKVRLGRTALEAKAMLGAEPEVLTHYIAFQNRLLRYPAIALLKYAGNVMGSAWKTRKPFKLQSDELQTQQI